jgi:hypothetical protein
MNHYADGYADILRACVQEVVASLNGGYDATRSDNDALYFLSGGNVVATITYQKTIIDGVTIYTGAYIND